MRKNRSESGSLHAVIIAVLFVALMAALGVVFYQNFVAKEPATVQKDDKPATEKPDMATARAAFGSYIYAADHPGDWKEAKQPTKTDGAIKGTELRLTAPSGKVAVRLVIDQAAASDACDQSDARKISYYNVRTGANLKLTGAPLALVESLFDHLGGGYDYRIGLTQESGATHAAVGDTYCNVALVGISSLYRAATDTKPLQPFIAATIEFPELPAGEEKPSSPDMQTVRDLMATSEYKEAVAVLESARKEE